MSANEDFKVNHEVHLDAVTANQISAILIVDVGYLCPEDYMSMEAMAGITP